MVPDGDPAMEATFAKARKALDEFLAVVASPSPGASSFAVKVEIVDGDQHEFSGSRPSSRRGIHSPAE